MAQCGSDFAPSHAYTRPLCRAAWLHAGLMPYRPQPRPPMRNILTSLMLLAVLAGCSKFDLGGQRSALPAELYSGCTMKGNEADAKASLGHYMATTNAWNPSAAEYFSTCFKARLDNGTGLVDAKLNWNVMGSNNQVLAFPNLAYGWQVGTDQGSTTRKLPATVAKMDDVRASGRVETLCAPGATCVMNTAFDLLFANNPTPTTWPPNAEIMVWVQATCKHCNAGKLVGKVGIDGVTWEVYKGMVTPPTGTASWTYVAYVAESTVTQFDLNFKNFVEDAFKRGYVNAGDYLSVVELGTEITSGQGSTTLTGYSVR